MATQYELTTLKVRKYIQDDCENIPKCTSANWFDNCKVIDTWWLKCKKQNCISIWGTPQSSTSGSQFQDTLRMDENALALNLEAKVLVPARCKQQIKVANNTSKK